MNHSTSTTKKHATRRNGHRTLATSVLTDTRLALYCRVSTDEQAEKNTLQAQLTFLRNWASLYDLPIVGEYTDEGISGTMPLPERSGASRMLADAQDGYFGAVAVFKVDRFARSLRVLLDGYNTLEDAGVSFKSATEPFDTSMPMGTFVFQMLGSMAELDRSNLIERMNLGRDRVTNEGKWVNGPIPLGYIVDALGCLIPSDRWVVQLGMTEAAMITDLFTRIAEGSSGTAEAIRFQTLGVPLTRYYTSGTVHTTASGQWHPSRVIKLIKTETYAGVHRVKSRFGTIERALPALVSRDLWERANAQIRENQKLPKPNASRVYLLRGLITCGQCRRAYVGQRMKGPSRRTPWYYRCNGLTASGSPDKAARCRSSALNATAMEEHIWQRCRYFILHPKETLAEIERQMAREPIPEDTTAREQALSRTLAEKHQEEERLLTVFRRGRITLQAFEAEMDRIEEERTAVQQELAALQAQHKRQSTRQDYAQRSVAMLAQWRARLADIEARNDRVEMQALVADFVSSITVHPDGVHVVYPTFRTPALNFLNNSGKKPKASKNHT